MSTRQAEEVLKHTFEQLEKMLGEVRRKEAGPRRPPGAAGERRTRDKNDAGPDRRKK